jgi:succinyl-diaminopimelate desuccinylase
MPAASPEQALAERTLALVDIPSVSRDEAQLYGYVKEHVGLPLVHDDGESLVYAKRAGLPLVLLSGHTDTVPIDGNVPGRVADGAVHGRGASDMKSGLAVMIELAAWAARAELGYDLALLFFPREELGPEWNPLPAVFESTPVVDESALVICLEPTDNTLQLGCLGNITARVLFEGRSAHSARPWLGVNAIALALEGLRPVLESEPLDVDVEGLVFREVVSVTQIDDCGNARNVIPGRVEATLNFRYAPNRTPAEAEARLRDLARREIEILEHSPAAPVALQSPLVERLREIGGFEVQPKQAWTNVADFAARGLDAINFGPGGTRYAHSPDEQVAISELVRTFDALKRFLAAS